MNQKISVVWLLVAIAIVVSMLQPMTVKAADTQSMIQAENKSDIEEKIHKLIEENKDATPSVAIAVFDDSQMISTVIEGKSDVENNIMADENTVYEWGSVSKVLVWTSAMQLHERGMLDLNKDIREYLPNGFLKKLKYDKPITMLDLMNHSAGFLTPYKDMETDDINHIMSLEEALREIEPAQAYEPGKTVAYSNYGAALAGYVIERISGMSYADYVNQNIFDRLGMEHTAIRPDLSDNEWVREQRRKTHCYIMGENGLVSLQECRRYIHLYPAGGACGTIGDLALFTKAFLSDSATCPLFDQATTLDEMLSASLYFSDGKTPRLCHGLMTEKVGLTTIGHGGNTEGFTSLIQFDPKEKTGFVMMINKQMDRIYQSELMNVLYQPVDFSSLKTENFHQYEFSGTYNITGGTFETGCFSLYHFFNDKFEVKKQNGTYAGSLGVTEVEQISDNAALFKLITGSENLVFLKTDDNGKFVGFENECFDFIKISSFEYYSGWTVFILMCVGLLLMVILAVKHFVSMKKDQWQEDRTFMRMEILMNFMGLMMVICICLMLKMNMASELVRMILCISIAILTVALWALNVISWMKKPKIQPCVSLIVETLCSTFITVGVIYWRLFQFWGM